MNDKKIKDVILSKTFPKYKNFDYTKQYDITMLIDMHHVIISAINELNRVLKTRNDKVSSCKKHNEGGVNLIQLIHVQTYNNNIINSKIEMFLNCLDSINSNNNYYFDNMLSKLKLCNNTPFSRGIGMSISNTIDPSFSLIDIHSKISNTTNTTTTNN